MVCGYGYGKINLLSLKNTVNGSMKRRILGDMGIFKMRDF